MQFSRVSVGQLPVGQLTVKFGWGSLQAFLGSKIFLLVVAASCIAWSGCSSNELNRKAVSGTITVDGAPLPNGSISFEPLVAGGIGSGAVITQGKYAIAIADGLPPGKYRVRITGDDGSNFGVSEGKMPGDEIMPVKKKLVPDSWNSNSKEEIEVPDSGKTNFDFQIDTKKK